MVDDEEARVRGRRCSTGSSPSGTRGRPGPEPRPADAPEPATERQEKSDKAKTRPAKRSRVEYRAEARVRQPVLADRLARWPGEHGISDTNYYAGFVVDPDGYRLEAYCGKA